MPRTSRAIVGNYCHHIINRGNQKARVFHEPGDYEQFMAWLARPLSLTNFAPA